MEKAIRVGAPAKLNLHLRVYGRREDGFHGLLSIFQAISLADEIVVRSLKESDRIDIRGDFDCPPERTSLHRMALAFRASTGLRQGLSIEVEKRIPAGAGLGGASSDAAALLYALDALFETGLPPAEQARLGAGIGSDVPFFLSGGAAIVAGRGEEVDPFPGRLDLGFLLINPGIQVPTPWAYALLDRERGEGDGAGEADPQAPELREAYGRDPGSWPFLNSFEPYIAAARKEIAQARALLESAGASFTLMSGSGSTVFGAFPDPERAEKARGNLEDSLPGGFRLSAASPLARFTRLD